MRNVASLIIAAAATALVACNQPETETEGPAEQAGEELDEAGAAVEREAGELGEDIERNAAAAEREARENLEATGDAIERETDEAAPPPRP